MSKLPSVLVLTADNHAVAKVAGLLGYYTLEEGREVNGAPVWRHAAGLNRYLCKSAVGKWMLQSKADLGTDRGYIHSKCIQPYPYGEEVGSDWVCKVYIEGKWTLKPSLKCTKAELPPFAPVISLTGDSHALEPHQAECLGNYTLEEGREVNGAPVWRHAAGLDRYLCKSAVCKWVFQSKADLGTHLGYINSKCIQLYPYGEEVGSDWVYKVCKEGKWTEELSLKCTKAPPELPLSEILRKLSDARARRHRGIPPPFVATFGPLVASIRSAITHGYGNGEIPPPTARAWDVLHTNPQRRAANMDEIQGIAKILKECPQVLCEVHGETATETSRPQISRDSQAAKLLQEKQELVYQQAVASPVDEARLMAAIAERDAARRACISGLRTHAETAAREAAESAKILSQAKATAVQALRQDWLDKGVSSSRMLWQCMDIVHGLQNQNGPLREGGAAKGAGSSGGGRETLSGGEALSQCKAVVRDYLVKHKDAAPFLDPVDWKALGLKDYPAIIKRPMDLGTIMKRLETGQYDSVLSVASDIDQVWANAMTYNQ
eukprot:jgi/Chrpa1/15532/Chrysochromulina_OHIO_Genome00022443-RA